MTKTGKKCCVVSCRRTACEPKGIHLHRFPNPNRNEERYEKWMKILNIAELKSMAPITVFTNKRICSIHFDSRNKSYGNPRLHSNGIPTLFLDNSKKSDKKTASKKVKQDVNEKKVQVPNVEEAISSKINQVESKLSDKHTNLKKSTTSLEITKGAAAKTYSNIQQKQNKRNKTEATCAQLNKIRDLLYEKTDKDCNVHLEVSHVACSIIGISMRQ